MNNLTRSITALAFLVCTTACSTVSPKYALLREPVPGRKFSRNEVPVAQLPKTFELIRDTAALSAVVYPDSRLDVPDRWEARPDLRQRAEDALANDPNPPRKQKHKPVGKLEYEVYVDSAVSPKIAVIAFRGTDSKVDWYSNLRWLTSWIPRIKDQYEQTVLLMPGLIRAIKADLGEDTKIVATGHSLGGGLAQTAGYVSCHDIAAVYAFDPSPVTKHRAAPPDCPDERPVYRLYEDTEILAFSRLPLRLTIGLSDANPRITEAKFHLLQSKLGGHSMQALAEAILQNIP